MGQNSTEVSVSTEHERMLNVPGASAHRWESKSDVPASSSRLLGNARGTTHSVQCLDRSAIHVVRVASGTVTFAYGISEVV